MAEINLKNYSHQFQMHLKPPVLFTENEENVLNLCLLPWKRFLKQGPIWKANRNRHNLPRRRPQQMQKMGKNLGMMTI